MTHPVSGTIGASTFALVLMTLLGSAQARDLDQPRTRTTRPTATPIQIRDAAVAGDVMVKLRSTAGLQGLLARYPLTLAGQFGARPIYRLRVVGAADAAEVVTGLALEPEVLIAETNAMHRSPEARRNAVWAIGSLGTFVEQWAPLAMRLPQAHLLSQGQGVRVAVLDTGVDASHPLLAGRLLPGKDFVDGDTNPSETFIAGSSSYGHGTHVAGLVALAAPAARIMPLRVLDAEGAGNAWVLAEAILHAIDPDGNPNTDDGAHIINLSLGSLSRTSIMGAIAQLAGCEPAEPGDPQGDRSDPGYNADRARCSLSTGALVVAAAGNDGSRQVRQYPAAEGKYSLMPVAASAAGGRLADFSNSGSWVALAAPGEGVTSTIPGQAWAAWSGTSMAAPLATGAAALLRAAQPLLSAKDVIRRLESSATVLCGTHIRQIDALAALVDTEPRKDSCR